MLRNLDALDALKGVAAVALAFYAWSGFTIWSGSAVVGQFYLFVDFFFVFTGFLIAEVYRDQMQSRADLGKFAILRLARLYPIHLFFLVPLAGIELMKLFYAALGAPQAGEAAFVADHLSLVGLAANLTFTQAFGLLDNPGWNEPSWYAATEFWVSILFAIACLFGLMRHAAGRAVLAAVAIGALAWMLAEPGTMKLENGGAFARGVYGFGVGVAAHSILRIDRIARWLAEIRRRFAGFIEAPSLVLVAIFIAHSDGVASFAAPVVFTVLIFVFADGRGAISRRLRGGFFRMLGKFSYSIYMSHFLFILPMRGMIETGGGKDVTIIATFAVGLFIALTIVFGIITERLVEAPTRDAIRRWLDGRSWAGGSLRQPKHRTI